MFRRLGDRVTELPGDEQTPVTRNRFSFDDIFFRKIERVTAASTSVLTTSGLLRAQSDPDDLRRSLWYDFTGDI